jgi:hypothetical protein
VLVGPITSRAWKGAEFELRNAAGETFAGLLQQYAGSRAQQQELAGGLAGPPALVDHAAQHGK